MGRTCSRRAVAADADMIAAQHLMVCWLGEFVTLQGRVTIGGSISSISCITRAGSPLNGVELHPVLRFQISSYCRLP